MDHKVSELIKKSKLLLNGAQSCTLKSIIQSKKALSNKNRTDPGIVASSKCINKA